MCRGGSGRGEEESDLVKTKHVISQLPRKQVVNVITALWQKVASHHGSVGFQWLGCHLSVLTAGKRREIRARPETSWLFANST